MYNVKIEIREFSISKKDIYVNIILYYIAWWIFTCENYIQDNSELYEEFEKKKWKPIVFL